MTYDTRRSVIVHFGGAINNSGLRSTETWEWDGSEWNQREISGPSAREGHSMAYDSARDVNVLFGGYTGLNASNSETWILGMPCPADFNHDDFIDFFDYSAFVAAFEGGEDDADFNDDGFVDLFDYSDFVAAFEAGC